MSAIEDQQEQKLRWPSFVKAVQTRYAALRESRRESARIKSRPGEGRLTELREKATRGRRARALLDGDFWAENLLPYLQTEGALKPANLRDGEAAPGEKAFLDYLVASGQARMATRLIAALERWDAEGAEADQQLSALALDSARPS